MKRWSVLIFLGSIFAANAADEPKKKKAKPGALLDFEDDVIEGDEQRPDLMILMGEKKVDLDFRPGPKPFIFQIQN